MPSQADETERHRIELFGKPRVTTAEGRVLRLKPKHAAVVTLIALKPGVRRSREEIIDILWTNGTVKDPRGSLREALSVLSAAIPGELFPDEAQSFVLDERTSVWIDLVECESLLAAAHKAEGAEARTALLHRAAELCSEPLLFGYRKECKEIALARDRYSRLADWATQFPSAAALPNRKEPANTQTGFTRSRRYDGPVALVAVLAVVLIFLILAAWLPIRPRAASPEERIRLLRRLDADGTRLGGRDQDSRMRQEADICLSLGEDAWAEAYRRGEAEWGLRLRSVGGPIRSVLRWLLAHGKPEEAQQLAGALSRYWWIERQQAEAATWLGPSIERSRNIDSLFRARALSMHAMCVMDEGDRRARKREADKEALAEIEQANRMYTGLHDSWGQAHTLRCEGHVLHDMGKQADAERTFNEALRIFHDHGYLSCEAYTYWGVGLIPPKPGETPEAAVLRAAKSMLTSVQKQQRAGNDYNLSLALGDLTRLVDGIVERPDRRARPQFQSLLNSYIDACIVQLQRQIDRSEQQDAMNTRKHIARAAVFVHRLPLAVEQLGWIVGPETTITDNEVRCRLAAAYVAYVNNMHLPPSAPISESWLRQLMKDLRLPEPTCSALLAEGRQMPLETAVNLATR